ncbi:MAG: hypothetical protein KF900_00475 [Bacteroidetes bacterium]|nr:hypothetical protein [Bacteroidota bacterium]
MSGFSLSAQWLNFPRDSTDTVYDRKEEILYKDKRYRLYNNYVTLGGGMLFSDARTKMQKMLGADFHFHIKRHYFQIGIMTSGLEFFSNNHLQAHLCYGLRREDNTTNVAFFAGTSFFQGVAGIPGQTDPVIYKGIGLYVSAQAVSKFVAYDVGLGTELFADISIQQRIVGAKLIVFFSSAYKGVARRINPNVKRKATK